MKWFHLFLLKPISKLLGFIFKHRATKFTLAVVLHFLANLSVNGVLAGYVVSHFSTAASFCIIFVATVLKVVVMVALYDYYGRDIFGLEKAKDGKGENKIVRKIQGLLNRLTSKRSFLASLLLILIDHFFGVVYIRKSHHLYRGIPREDWLVITVALLIATTALVVGWQILIKIFLVLYIHLGLEGCLISLSVVLICIFVFKKLKKRYRR